MQRRQAELGSAVMRRYLPALTVTFALLGSSATAYGQTPAPSPMSDPAELDCRAFEVETGQDDPNCPPVQDERDELPLTGPREAAVYGATGVALVGLGALIVVVAGKPRRGLHAPR